MPTPAAVFERHLRELEARAAELQQQIGALQQEAGRVEGELSRWRIGEGVWEEVEQELRGVRADGPAGEVADGVDQAAVAVAADGDAAAGPSGPAGGGGSESRYVPQRAEGADPARLPGLYAKIVEFVTGAEVPVRVPEVVVALFGEGASRSRHEGVRAQMKRLLQRDWLTSEDGRFFAPASG